MCKDYDSNDIIELLNKLSVQKINQTEVHCIHCGELFFGRGECYCPACENTFFDPVAFMKRKKKPTLLKPI